MRPNSKIPGFECSPTEGTADLMQRFPASNGAISRSSALQKDHTVFLVS